MEKFRDDMDKTQNHAEIISPSVHQSNSQVNGVSLVLNVLVRLLHFTTPLGLFYQHGLTSVPAWINNYTSRSCGMKLLIHSQTSNSEAVKMSGTWRALWLIYDLAISFSAVWNTLLQMSFTKFK